MDLDRLRAVLSGPLETETPAGEYREAAVLVAIYGREPRVVMTVKHEGLRVHAGEVSFPGGKREVGDSDLLDTALRETREEIGLEIPRRLVSGRLSDVVTLNSGFRIAPFVAVLDAIPPLLPSGEVGQILRMPLGPLLRTLEDDRRPEHRSIGGMYTLRYRDRVVWGASARILRQVALLVEGMRL